MGDLEVLDALARFIDARLPGAEAPGTVVGITRADAPLGVVARGLSDATTGTPLLPDARFQIGSVSKSFAAVIVLQEVEAGTLDLQAPVTEYVPWFRVPGMDPAGAPAITLHHLLSHTAGLIMGTDVGCDAVHEVWALRDIPCAGPGDRFSYSNAGFKLVGLILEAVTGKSFPQLLQERIFGPLGMTDSDPAITAAARETVALPHQRAYDDRPEHRLQPQLISPWDESVSADGSIISTAADMSAYARLLLNGGRLPGGESLLSAESFVRLTGRVAADPLEPDAVYGYGLARRVFDGCEIVCHSGSTLGYCAYLALDFEAGLGVVVLKNGFEDRGDLVRFALAAARAAGEGAPVPEPPPPADRTVVEHAEAYAGTYRPPGGRLGRAPVLQAQAGRLVLHRGFEEVELERHEGDVFLLPDADWDHHFVQFGRNADGEVAELFHGPHWFVNERYSGPDDYPLPPDHAVVCGEYRCHNPWMTYLEVFVRKGVLYLWAPWVEGQFGTVEAELTALGDLTFRVGADPWLPDRIRFDALVEGAATRATFDLQPFYRFARP